MKKNKVVQFFSKERLLQDRHLPKEEIVQFIEGFQEILAGDEGKRKLISIRIPENLLKHFKLRAKRQGVPYQTLIVELMRKWVKETR